MGVQTVNKKTTVAGECPAFEGGKCPYSNMDAKMVSEKGTEKFQELVKGCPAFENGCPFKKAEDMDDLGKLLSVVPPSHLVDGKRMGSVQALKSLIAGIHERSVDVRKRVGAECPIFSTSCPFKTITSAGTPLVSELEYRTWSVAGAIEDRMGSNGDDNDHVEEGEERVALAKMLKAGTRKSHRAAENVHFVKKFIKGKIDLELYKSMTTSLWYVYSALEDQLRANADNEVYRSLHFPKELERVPSLEEDLAYYFGADWRDTIPPMTPCTKEYVDRINAIGRDTPELLVAHAYTRYLGDLSGGQILMRVAKKALKLPEDGSGSSFYRFPLIPKARDFKKKYRALLDGVRMSTSSADCIVAEANLAFVMNMRVFEELDVRAGDSDAVRSLAAVLDTLNLPVVKGEKCPFAVVGSGYNPHAAMAPSKQAKGECPWPFILLHDPVKGAQNPLTWILVLIIAAIVGFFFTGAAM